MKFAKEAWPFVLPFVVLALGLGWLGHLRWAVAAAGTALLVLLFFRDPRRSFSGPPQQIVAPTDGLVTRIDTVEDPAVGEGRFHRVVTFLSVFDVHVQKVPVSGRVLVSELTPGKKVAAFVEHADRVNENHLTVLELENGDRVGVRQIAGLVARRVVCYLQPQQRVERGDPLGIIKFGSRVDLLVPEGYDILVTEKQRLRNGATAVALPPGDR